jgi:hypothetical protein
MAGENTARDFNNQEALENARKQEPGQTHPSDLHVPHAADENVRYGENNNDSQNNDSRVGSLAQIKETAKLAKNVAGVAAGSPGAAIALGEDALSLWKQVDFMGDMPFAAALGAAILKDLIDIPTFETIILPVLFSMLCSIFIFMMILLTGSSGKKKIAKTIFKKIGVLLGGGVADSIPGLSVFPIETFTVILIYVLTLIERKSSK